MAVFNPEMAARMKMPKELLDEASSLHLAMHLSEQSVEAALFDAATSQCKWHVFVDITALSDPAQFVYERNWNEQVFRKCSVSFDCDRFALIPKAYFDENLCAEYIRLQHGSISSDTTYLELSEIDAVLCFALPSWHQRVVSMMPNARLIPSAALLMRYARMHAPREGSAFITWVCAQSMTLACMKEKNPVLLASNAVSSEEDVLYYLSNAAMQLDVDLENVSLNLLVSAPGMEVKPLLERYIVNIISLSSSVSCPEGSFMPQLHAICA